jgi:tRNA G18 (ribose-2'-O)-methylase SpoU
VTETRNLIDFYHYWSNEAIKADLDTKKHNFSVLLTNQIRDFNLGSVIRNSNAFLAKEVIIYGDKKYDRRSTVGTHIYQNIRNVKFTEKLDLGDAIVVGVDNIPNAQPLETFKWDYNRHTILAFGEENRGLLKEIQSICHNIVYIKQYGSIRSLNLGCASAITMFDYCQKMGSDYVKIPESGEQLLS